MMWTRLARWLAAFALLLPAIAYAQQPDGDFDGVVDALDNCSELPNPAQDDSDGDFCGNLCDADYEQDGTVDFGDFGAVIAYFGNKGAAYEEYCHTEPIAPCTVGFASFGFLMRNYGSTPGPSGTTPGTIACP